MLGSCNRRPRVYLAGPDVFFPEAFKHAQERKEILAERGMEGVFPLDSEPGGESPPMSASAIFSKNRQLIDSCQAVLANITPFRGPSADVGTAWEIGYACGQGKPVVGYSADLSIYKEKVFQHGWSGAARVLFDREGNQIENFEGVDNLMLTQSVVAICATFAEAAATLQRALSRGPAK